MTLPNTADIVVVGGGGMRASTLYHLAARGQMQEMDYHQCGYLIVCADESDAATFKRNLLMQNKLGVGTIWLDGDEARRRLHLFNIEEAVGATFNQKDGLVDLNSVVVGYICMATKLGGKSFNNVEVTGIMIVDSLMIGVETNKGYISTPMIINAAGPWAGLISEMAGVKIPITPSRRQKFTTTPLSEVPTDLPFVIDFAQSPFFHCEGSGLLIGKSNSNEKYRFDQNVDEDFELVNQEAGIARLLSHWEGLYEVVRMRIRSSARHLWMGSRLWVDSLVKILCTAPSLVN